MLVLLLAAPSALAQATGSRHLAVDHWAYEYIQRLRHRGYLPNLNPLVQPYRRIEVARGLARVDPGSLKWPEGEWVRLLREELAPELARVEGREARRWGVELTAGGRASTSQRLDPLRPWGDADAWPRYTAGGWFEMGPFAVESRLAGDVFLTHDPDGADPGQIRGGRADNAYLAAAAPFGAITIGRFKQNWGPPGTRGLMVSDAATPYPQLAFEARAGRFSLRSLTGELETLFGAKRYLSAHRFDYAAENLVVSFGEALLYAQTRGSALLRYLNPLELLLFDENNQPNDLIPNVVLDAQVWLRRGGLAVFGEAMLDDVDVIPAEGKDFAPPRYGFTIGADAMLGAGAGPRLRLEYRQVSSYAYRTMMRVDHYSFLGRGLGDNYADFDRLAVTLEFSPTVRGLLLSPSLHVQRQGEGDLRVPFPSPDEFVASPWLLLGVAETTYRFALSGRYQRSRHLWLKWDLGPNFMRNAGHVSGVRGWKFSGVVEGGFAIELPLQRR